MSDPGPCSVPGSGCNPPQLKFYQAFTFATPIIFTLVLLLLFCVLYVRRRQTARAVSQLRAQFFARGIFSAWPVDHGLTKSFRATLPTVVFDEHFAASREDNQCAVCLSDYQLGEKLQQLPLCDHVFHVECIDEWLASNATCPICRTSLLQVGKLVPLDSINTVAVSQESHHGETSDRNGSVAATSSGPEAPACSSGSSIVPLETIATTTTSSNHRSVPSMEEAVKDSAEHVIHIERS